MTGTFSVTRTGSTQQGQGPIEPRMQGFGRLQGGISALGIAIRRLA